MAGDKIIVGIYIRSGGNGSSFLRRIYQYGSVGQCGNKTDWVDLGGLE